MLTKEDLSYIRRANDIYCINIDGKNFLRVVKRGDSSDRFSEDKAVDIPIDGNGSNGFFTNAWEFPWRNTLRTGDEVSLYWYPDAHTNQYCRDAGLHADALYVDIFHKRDNKKIRYLVTTSICLDNSARMCRIPHAPPLRRRTYPSLSDRR